MTHCPGRYWSCIRQHIVIIATWFVVCPVDGSTAGSAGGLCRVSQGQCGGADAVYGHGEGREVRAEAGGG